MTDRFILRKNENGKSVRVTFSANGHDGKPLLEKTAPGKSLLWESISKYSAKKPFGSQFLFFYQLRLTENQGVTNLTDRGWLNG